MNKFLTVFNLILCISATATAQDDIPTRSLPPLLLSDCEEMVKPYAQDRTASFNCILHNNASVSESIEIYVKTACAGQLADLLGNNWMQVETLHVEGPINSEDFSSLWSCAFEGNLKVLDLGGASVEDGIIPDYALFHTDEQVDWVTGIIYTIGLQKLILPGNTVEIGRHAFAYATRLTEIQFPETLERIGVASFTNCTRLATDPFVLPPNLDVLGYQAFYECFSLAGEVILPSKLRIIDGCVFYHNPIKKINIPETVEYLGDFAFYGTKLEEIYLPDNCYLDSRGAQFYGCYELKKAHLPSVCEIIPDDLFCYCTNLEEVNMPGGVTHIGMNAFDMCTSLNSFSTLVFHEGLLDIGRQAFTQVPIKELHLPSTVNYLGSEAFYFCSDLERIYCQAVNPPECEIWNLSPDRGPFYGIPSDIKVFIPVNTKIEYSAAFGWDYFTNFIETDDFPFAGIENITTDSTWYHNNIFDIYGRPVLNPVPGSLYICDGKKFIYHN